MKAEGCTTAAEEDCGWEAGGSCGATTVVGAFRFKLLGCTGVVDVATVVVLAAGVELAGVEVFIFRASSSGLEAAGAVLTLLLGLGSRLITGMAELDAVGRGAASRLLRVVVEVELVEDAGRVEVVAAGDADFSGSGAGVSSTFWILLIAAFFSSSRSFTVMV